ncbi:MAG TPA: SpoIIE family protein phosphatase [Gammaproteobacteria bacterium]|nr:SpoIIE family protein phosphatase [Gammaproteobacteria bacterium]
MAQNTSIVQWGIAARARKGEPDSGERHLVMEGSAGVLIAVIAGVGHGSEAAATAEQAVQALRKAAAGTNLIELINHCHQHLLGTGGSVISMGLLNGQERSLSWLGVGNVEAAVLNKNRRKPARLLLRNGVVGRWLPILQAYTLSLEPGDLLVFTTDGVDNRFTDELQPAGDPQAVAERIVQDYGLQSDDVLALVVRYTGAPL